MYKFSISSLARVRTGSWTDPPRGGDLNRLTENPYKGSLSRQITILD